MSKEEVKKTIGKLISDDSFREEFLSDQEAALSSLDLSDEEASALKQITKAELDELDVNVDELAEVSALGPKIGIYIWK